MISKIVIKTSFKTRLFVSIVLLALGTGYVLTPKEFQPFILIPYVVFFIAYMIVYLRYDVRTLNLISKKKTQTLTPFSDFNPNIEQIFQSFSTKLENKIKIVFSNVVDNFEARPSHKIIYVNPEYAKKADEREIEGSLYHELGHVKESWTYFFDTMTFSLIPLFYWMFFTAISVVRGDIPIIPTISAVVLTLLMMIIIFWRNEYRADDFASKYVSLESMEKMLEPITVKYSVETHPSPSKRLIRISKKY
jgi:hypothetical protein